MKFKGNWDMLQGKKNICTYRQSFTGNLEQSREIKQGWRGPEHLPSVFCQVLFLEGRQRPRLCLHPV